MPAPVRFSRPGRRSIPEGSTDLGGART